MSFAYSLGRAFRAIWNGPFYIGKLSQPVSIGDTLMKILETAWRTLAAVVILILIVALMISGWAYILNPVFFPPAKDYLEISVEFDDGTKHIPPTVSLPVAGIASTVKIPFRCDKSYPMKVTIANNGNRPISDVRFSLVGRAAGFSTNYISGGDYFESPKIIKPHMGWMSCYSVLFKDDADPAILRFDAEVLSAEYSSK
jgi:hypothetical protein